MIQPFILIPLVPLCLRPAAAGGTRVTDLARRSLVLLIEPRPASWRRARPGARVRLGNGAFVHAALQGAGSPNVRREAAVNTVRAPTPGSADPARAGHARAMLTVGAGTDERSCIAYMPVFAFSA